LEVDEGEDEERYGAGQEQIVDLDHDVTLLRHHELVECEVDRRHGFFVALRTHHRISDSTA
jgi:hypothetical protein